MKKINNLIVICISLVISLTVLFSCGNSSEKKNNTLETIDEIETDGIEDRNNDNGVKIIPVYSYDETKDEYGSSKYAFKKGNNYITFDNDEDYSDLIPTLKFISNIEHGILWDWRDVGKIDNLGESIKKEQLPLVDDLRNKLVQYVLLYLNGQKDKISDKYFYKIIDKAYYDDHPDDVNGYRVLTDRYNNKEYSVFIDEKYYGTGWVIPVEEYREIIGYSIVTINGEELEDDVLIVKT